MSISDLMKQAQIASPCTADWDAMTGDDKMRLCGQCNKHVLNAIEMTDEEVLDAFARMASGQRVCMQLYRRSDGTFLTKDCPVGLAKKLAAGARRAAAWISGGLSLLLSLAGVAGAQTASQSGAAGKKEGDAGKPVWHSTIKSSDASQRAGAANPGNPSAAPAQTNIRMIKGEMAMPPCNMSPPIVAARKAVAAAEKDSGTDSAPCAVQVMKLADALFSALSYEEAQQNYLRVLQMADKNKVIKPHAQRACMQLAAIAKAQSMEQQQKTWLQRAETYAPKKTTGK